MDTTKKEAKYESVAIEEETYHRLAEMCIREKKGRRRIPTYSYLKTSLHVLYIIHQKQYTTFEEFCNLLMKSSENCNQTMEGLKVHIVGNYFNQLYSGLWGFCERYLSNEEKIIWKKVGREQRFDILKEAEERLYKEMVLKSNG